MIVICGLGNPGTKYKNTRHNIGFEFIDKILNDYKLQLSKKDKLKEVYKVKIKNINYFLIKPLTYVNLSGPTIANFLNFYKIPKKNLIVVHDDLDLSLGKIKSKFGGGNAGHNGLSSIDRAIGNSYHRLRIGIGHPGSKELVTKFVLKKIRKKDKEIINKVIGFAQDNLELLIKNKQLFLTRVNALLQKNI